LIIDWSLTFYTINTLITTNVNFIEQIGFIFLAGLLAGTNINACHELMHKDNDPIDRLLGCLSLSKHMYMHFYIEHNHGQHIRVATPEDPATSRRG
jgi:alkane 1-monooxygenase